jgi:cob(I)alamin adenosyltransferase
MVRTGIGIRTAQDRAERLVGQTHVYDGAGKGKSQAALGVVLRSIGLGIQTGFQTRVLLLRFLKGPGRTYDEDAAIEALRRSFPHLTPKRLPASIAWKRSAVGMWQKGRSRRVCIP